MGKTIFERTSLRWEVKEEDLWLVLGSNGSAKSDLAERLARREIDIHADSVSLVSLERASSLVEEERKNDDSDFVEGGVDQGRTVDLFLSTGKTGDESKKQYWKQWCGIDRLGSRGLKFLSTGEIRKVLLCKALLDAPDIILLDEPFDGLDAKSRDALLSLLETRNGQRFMLFMDRFAFIPNSVSHVLYLEGSAPSFCGTIHAFRQTALLSPNTGTVSAEAFAAAQAETRKLSLNGLADHNTNAPLVRMINVSVEWSEKKILDGINWTLNRGEHWRIQGPNGSGKTTLLELITGDNPQVFRNEVYLFGSRRGSGETIWEIKSRLGIVSYKLHLEYRMLGSVSLEDVVLSGFHDSIGMYEERSEAERVAAAKWLSLTGFEGRGGEDFKSLSWGEQRCALILRAAIKGPDLLILDEPCHGLDSEHREQVLELLDKIAEMGQSTLLHVTHDPTETLSCCTRSFILQPGKVPMYSIDGV